LIHFLGDLCGFICFPPNYPWGQGIKIQISRVSNMPGRPRALNISLTGDKYFISSDHNLPKEGAQMKRRMSAEIGGNKFFRGRGFSPRRVSGTTTKIARACAQSEALMLSIFPASSALPGHYQKRMEERKDWLPKETIQAMTTGRSSARPSFSFRKIRRTPLSALILIAPWRPQLSRIFLITTSWRNPASG
jgi:hypothetical protein